MTLRLAGMDGALPCLLILLITIFAVSTECLDVGFYKTNCPANANVEGVIKAVVRVKYQKDKSIVPGLLRMYFHDCFVQVCKRNSLCPLLDLVNTGSHSGGFEFLIIRYDMPLQQFLEMICLLRPCKQWVVGTDFNGIKLTKKKLQVRSLISRNTKVHC